MSAPDGTGCVLLVDAGPEEAAALGGLPGAQTLTAAEVEERVAACGDAVDVVVVGSGASAAVPLVQRVHRAAPYAGVVVVPAASSATEVRRQFAYAPGVPLELSVLDADDVLSEQVARLRATAVERRRHLALVAAVSARSAGVRAPDRPAVAGLGALLQHAPLGVLVCDHSGHLLGWNPRAEGLLGVRAEAVGAPVEDLLPGAGTLVASVTSSARGHAGASVSAPPLELTAAGDVDLEVSAVGSQLDDGRPVALLVLLDVTARRAAERTRDRLAGHVELLGRVSESLISTLDTTEALSRLASCLVPALSDWVSVQLADESGGLSVVAMHHRDATLAPVVDEARIRQAAARDDRAPSRRAAAGEPVLLPHLTEADLPSYVEDEELRRLAARLGVSSVLAVPLPGRDSVLGSLVLVRGPASRQLTEADVPVAVEVGRRAGIALDNARLYSQQRRLATELQRSLLTAPPQPDHCQIVVRYVAASRAAQVGGDWYDAFVQPDGTTVLVIGDVVGHDTRAAAAMGQLRGLLRGIGFTTNAEPAEVLTRVDRAIERLLLATTATAVVARLEQTPSERAAGLTRVRWSNAGHPPPIVLRPDGRVEVLDAGGTAAVAGVPVRAEGDLLLGIDPDSPRRTSSTVLPRGSTVLLYTDGLVERRGQSLDEGVAALVTALGECEDYSLDELCDSVVARLLPDEPEDDVALVAVRLHRQDRPRPAEAGPGRLPPGLG